MKTLLCACLCLVPVGGCVEPPVAASPSNNPNIEVETLLTHDGCTVYRFRDGTYHYFVRCADRKTASTQSRIACGKNCSRPEEIETVATSPTP